MRVLIHSNAPWVPSGYGQGTALFAQTLREAGVEVGISAFCGLQYGMQGWNGFPVYPVGHLRWGQDIVGAHANHFQADVVLALMDSWVLDEAAARSPIPWVFWSPVDQSPLPPRLKAAIQASTLFGVFSEWGRDVAAAAGEFDNLRYLPLGIDTRVYSPVPKREARTHTKLPQDKYIVGMVAANTCTQSRKAWAQQLEGFSLFQKRNPDAHLYLHTDVLPATDGGWSVDEMIDQYGIRDCTTVVERYKSMLGFSQSHMQHLYSSFDVLLACSAAEGFGLPILEAQSCGTPVIVGDWTSMTEVFGEGVAVDPKYAMKWRAVQGGYWYYPEPDAIAEALTVMRLGSWKPESARAFAQQFEGRRVTREHLIPVLQEAVSIGRSVA